MALGRSCHTQLDGICEVFQNLSPVAIVLGAATMTLIDNHQIEELWLKQLFVVLSTLFADELLVEGEINLMGSIRILLILLVADLMNGIGQRLEILFDGLVNQHVAISQVEHLLDETRLQQSIDNLKSTTSSK